MLDLQNEKMINFSQAARLIPGGVHRATIGRWARTGVRGIRLECEIIGGRTVTTEEAVWRFLAACREKRFAGIANAAWIELAMAEKERFDELIRQVEGRPGVELG